MFSKLDFCEPEFDSFRSWKEKTFKIEGALRYLSVWDIYSGKPRTEPKDGTFNYKKGDYFFIAASNASSEKAFSVYLPCGNSYPQREELMVNAVDSKPYLYIYDGDCNWTEKKVPSEEDILTSGLNF